MHWQLEDDQARATADSCEIKMVPAEPTRFAKIQLDGELTSKWEALAVTPLPQHSLAAEEIYVRGKDVIARFGQTDADDYAFQLDWQLLPAAAPFVVGVELWLSIQTQLLDTRPALEVACRGPKSTLWELVEHAQLCAEDAAEGSELPRGPAAMLCRNSHSTGVWLIEPMDQPHTKIVSAQQDATIRTRIFGDFLEKGVIRRARMRFLVAQGALSMAELAQAYQDFASSPLPLTA